jgi:hypothetical protein
MKPLFLAGLIFISSLFLSNKLNAQNSKLIEPEFAGAGIILHEDSTTEELERTKIQYDTKVKGLVNMSVSMNLIVEGCCSSVFVEQSSKPLKVLVRAKDNTVDPTTIYKVIKLDKDKKGRRTTTLSFVQTKVMSLKAPKSEDKVDELIFSGKKFGESSYLLSITVTTPGEYVIIESNGPSWTMMNVSTGLFFAVK